MCEVEVDPGDETPVTCTEQSLNNTVYSGVLHLMINVRRMDAGVNYIYTYIYIYLYTYSC